MSLRNCFLVMSVPFWSVPILFCSLATGAAIVGIEDYATINSPDSVRMSVMTTDPNGRLFVNGQGGELYTVDRSTRVVSPYLDLGDSSSYPSVGLVSGGERGFQSFAFHPDFYNSGASGFGKFYTIHSSTNTTPPPTFTTSGSTNFHTVLLEWTTTTPNAPTFQPANSSTPFREVARFQQPFNNHNAGQIAFNTSVSTGNPDRGNLYIALGDGGSGGDPLGSGQDTSTPYGAILRIDPLGNNSTNGQYGIVSANALASDGDGATLGEIFCYGLRNPQRFSWDALTGEMYIADIGQGAFEEINQGANGGNFGWNTYEGSETPLPDGFINPVAEYPHEGFVTNAVTGSRAVTVGDVVRGSDLSELEGLLLLGDFPNGIIYTLDVDGDPLDGGSDGLSELVLLDENGQAVRLIDLIRSVPGNENQNRADLRFSYGIDGEVFILNKHDNVIRRLVTAVPEPSAASVLLTMAFGWGARRRRK